MSTKFSWELRPTDGGVDYGEELNEQLPLLVRRILSQRGICGREMAERFLRPRLADLGDPFDMREMDAAVCRIFRAVDHGTAAKCGFTELDSDAEDFLSFRLVASCFDVTTDGYKEVVLSEAPSYVGRDSFMMYRYYKLAFDGINFKNPPVWIRIEIFVKGQTDEKPFDPYPFRLY